MMHTTPGQSMGTVHSSLVLIASVAAAILFVLAVMSMPRPLWGPGTTVLYQAPVVAAFTAFAIERMVRYRAVRPWQRMLDAIIVAVAATRALFPLPFVSGHAMFLAYSVLTTERGAARWLAIFVLAEVIIAKAFYLHDPTWAGGILVGGAVGLMWVRGRDAT